MRTAIRLLVILGMAAAPRAATALDQCKAKVDKKTGAISVEAKDVQGPVRWGRVPGFALNSFFNEDSCVSGTRARKCFLDDPETLAGRTPPAQCSVYVNDGQDECAALVPGCVPGFREVRQTSNFFSAFTNSGGTFPFQTLCHLDEVLVGGGHDVDSGEEGVRVVSSGPATSGAQPAWRVKILVDPDTGYGLLVWAFCAK